MKNKVLVIIVTYNAMHWAKRCFDSLLQSKEPVDVFVIDNGSTDGTQAYIQNNYPFVHFEQSQTNDGFGKANNKGLRYAFKGDYEYAYLLNQDAWIFPDTISKLLDVQRSNPEYAILSPMQMQANMEFLDDNFIEFTCCFSSNKKLFSDLFADRRNELYEVDFVMAAHWLMDLSIVRKVGIFSPSFPHYREDNNLISRIKYHGYKVGIVLSSLAVHDRENREITIQKEMHFHYTSVILMLSDPRSNITLYAHSFEFVKAAIKHKSCIPLKHLWLLWKNYPQIKLNKRLSLTSVGAFI